MKLGRELVHSLYYLHTWKSDWIRATKISPLFTKRTYIVPYDLVQSRSRETGCYNGHIALRFGSHPGSAAAESPVEFYSGWKRLRLHEILWQDVPPFSEKRPSIGLVPVQHLHTVVYWHARFAKANLFQPLISDEQNIYQYMFWPSNWYLSCSDPFLCIDPMSTSHIVTGPTQKASNSFVPDTNALWCIEVSTNTFMNFRNT